jgi:hypothetical protein
MGVLVLHHIVMNYNIQYSDCFSVVMNSLHTYTNATQNFEA